MSDTGRIEYAPGYRPDHRAHMSTVNAEHMASWATDREELNQLRAENERLKRVATAAGEVLRHGRRFPPRPQWRALCAALAALEGRE